MIRKLIAHIKLKPDFEEGKEIKRIYANYFEVTHSKFDFTFVFCDGDLSQLSRPEIIEKFQKESKEVGIPEVGIPIVAKIAIPTVLIPPIIKALKINYEKYSQKLKNGEFEKK